MSTSNHPEVPLVKVSVFPSDLRASGWVPLVEVRDAIAVAHVCGWRSEHGLVGLFDVEPGSAEPVPAGHTRLIDADMLLRRLDLAGDET